MTQAKKTIGIVGARGHTGAEFITLLADHPNFELIYVSSRALAGEMVADHVDAWSGDLRYQALIPADVVEYSADVCVLALPNGISPAFIEAIDDGRPDTIVIDLSSDHRFDDGWIYAQPERFREEIRGATRIANPGCYATGMQLGLWPIIELMGSPPQVFGVSGYSGAGTTPSPKNDLDILSDNLMPYSLTAHTHEKEVSRHLGKKVYFSPHVAPFFRGITLTISVVLEQALSVGEIRKIYEEKYASEPLIEVYDEAPLVKDNVGEHVARVGGFSVDEEHVVFVVTLDNLLKGAATQAMQNANLSCGFDELEAIR